MAFGRISSQPLGGSRPEDVERRRRRDANSASLVANREATRKGDSTVRRAVHADEASPSRPLPVAGMIAPKTSQPPPKTNQRPQSNTRITSSRKIAEEASPSRPMHIAGMKTPDEVRNERAASRVRDYNASTSGAQPISHPNLPDHDAVLPPTSRTGEFHGSIKAIDNATPKNAKYDPTTLKRH